MAIKPHKSTKHPQPNKLPKPKVKTSGKKFTKGGR